MKRISWRENGETKTGEVLAAVVKDGQTLLVIWMPDGCVREVPIGRIRQN